MRSILWGKCGEWGGSGGGRNPGKEPPTSDEEVGELSAPSSPLFTSQAWDASPVLSHVRPSTLLPGSQPRPCPSSSSWELPQSLCPSMESSFCYLVSGLGARDPSPQIDSILSRAQPSSHIPQRPGAQVAPHKLGAHHFYRCSFWGFFVCSTRVELLRKS